jgi:hypothetical protein
MKRIVIIVAVTVAAGIVAGDTPAPMLSPQQQNDLTTIDELPTQDQLTTTFGSGSGSSFAATQLASVADDTDPTKFGVRLRAIRSLASFCPPPSGQTTGCDPASTAHMTLTQLIDNNGSASAGRDLLTLRAAIEAIGQLQVAGDEQTIATYLDNPNRDVRATAAFALRDLCNTAAIGSLRTRLQHESSAQVQLAISAALRVLGQTPLACTGA